MSPSPSVDIYFTSVLYHYPANTLTVIEGEAISLESEALLEISARALEAIDLEPIDIISSAILNLLALGIEEIDIEPITSTVALAYFAPSGFITVEYYRFTSSAILRYTTPFGFDLLDSLQIETEAIFRLQGFSSLSFIKDYFSFTSTALLKLPAVDGFQIVDPGHLTSEATLAYAGASTFDRPLPYQFTGTGLIILSLYPGFTPPDVILIETTALCRYATASTFQTEAPAYQFESEAVLEHEAVGLAPGVIGYLHTSSALLIHSTQDGFTPLEVTRLESEALYQYRSTPEYPTSPEPVSLTSTAKLKYDTAIGFAVLLEQYQLESEALFKYTTLLGFEAEVGEELESEAILKLVSAATIRAYSEALQIASTALFKWDSQAEFDYVSLAVQLTSAATIEYGTISGFVPEAVAILIESEANLYLNHVPSVAAITETITSITSYAAIRYTPVSGLTIEIVTTEEETVEIESAASLLYGGLTESLLHFITQEYTELTSKALLYFYGKDTLGSDIYYPYQHTGLGLLKYAGSSSLLIVEVSPETVSSEPVLLYIFHEDDGLVETEVYETWVITTQEWNPSMYSGWNFNSFIEIDGKCYGAKDDGIYLLEGLTDAGALIRTGVRLQTNFNLHGFKRIRSIRAENCGAQARLRVTETDENMSSDFELYRKDFRGNRGLMGREFILDFEDFDEMGHLEIIPQVMVRDGRKG